MKKLISTFLALAMILSLSSTAFAVETADTTDRISRADIESLFASKPAALSSEGEEEQEALFLDTINRLQELHFQQEIANNNGESTTEIDNEISELEQIIDQLPHAIRLTEDMPVTRGIKPTLPSSNSYVDVYGYDKTATYGGKSYDVFEIYCASKRAGGFANPLGYEGTITLATDSKCEQNKYMQQEVYATAKFIAGSIYPAFSVADFLVLSKMPDFFADGSSQKLTAQYRLGQTFLFVYVADKGVNWYDHMLTTERLSFSDTVIAEYTYRGITDHQSKSTNRLKYASYYPTASESTSKAAANYAAKIYATTFNREAYYVGSITYYCNNVKKGTINTNSFGELYAIPGL